MPGQLKIQALELTLLAVLMFCLVMSTQADAAHMRNLSRQHSQNTAIDLIANWFDGGIKFDDDRFASIMEFEINNIERGE